MMVVLQVLVCVIGVLLLIFTGWLADKLLCPLIRLHGTSAEEPDDASSPSRHQFAADRAGRSSRDPAQTYSPLWMPKPWP
jgi:hypothetical protein